MMKPALTILTTSTTSTIYYCCAHHRYPAAPATAAAIGALPPLVLRPPPLCPPSTTHSRYAHHHPPSPFEDSTTLPSLTQLLLHLPTFHLLPQPPLPSSRPYRCSAAAAPFLAAAAVGTFGCVRLRCHYFSCHPSCCGPSSRRCCCCCCPYCRCPYSRRCPHSLIHHDKHDE